MAEQYGNVVLDLYDNIEDGDVCLKCKTFDVPHIYCPVFNLIIKDELTVFDETGEKNRCQLFTKAD
jgi:hypothetical protein